MSLVNFKAQNHPQQTGKRGASEAVDDRGTTPEVFDPINARFAFTLDVAAAEHNTKCDLYYDANDDGLSQPWSGSVWCNPPYSGLAAWVEKSWVEWWKGYCSTIVMLLPANRTEQGWWQDLVEHFRDDPTSPLSVEFLRGRLRFDRPTAVIGPKGDRPPFGSCLLIWSKS